MRCAGRRCGRSSPSSSPSAPRCSPTRAGRRQPPARLFGAFALAGCAALAAGRGGRPCACFGAATRLRRATPIESGALALRGRDGRGGLAPGRPRRLHALADGRPYRQPRGRRRAGRGGPRARPRDRRPAAVVAGQGALEIPDEGPRVGESQPWAGAVALRPGTLLGLAVFSSEGCPICRRLEPAVAYLAADPLLSVRVFDEAADAAVWSAAVGAGKPLRGGARRRRRRAREGDLQQPRPAREHRRDGASARDAKGRSCRLRSAASAR